MQTVLVLITFLLAVGFILKKFVWSPLVEGQQKRTKSVDGLGTKCGKTDCGCH